MTVSTGLALRGVPLDAVHRFGEADASSTIFQVVQQLFDIGRGPGTPLLPAPAEAEDVLPAHRHRELIRELLMQFAGGPTVDLNEPDTAATYVELLMALAESAAGRAAARHPDPAPFAAADPEPRGVVLVPSVDAPWVPGAVAASAERMRDAAASVEVDPPESDGGVPPLRLARESAYWRGVPAHGAEMVAGGEAAGFALADAVAAGVRIDPDPFPLPARQPRVAEPDWVETARRRMSGQLASGLGPLSAPPSPSGAVAADTLRRFREGALGPEAVPPAGEPVIVRRGYAAAAFETIDVMRNYVVQPL